MRDIRTEINDKLKENNMSKRQFHFETNIRYATIKNFLNSKVGIKQEQLEIICKYLDIDISNHGLKPMPNAVLI